MKTVKLITSWALTIILIIATLPISLVIYMLADSDYTWTDLHEKKEPPKYFSNWFRFLEFPFRLLDVK